MASILAVDDSLSCRRLYSSYLKDACSLTIASSGKEALELARKNRFDLYITDLMMPGIDGISFIKKLRTFHPDAGVIVVSQTDEIDLAVGAFRQKPLEYLRKPIKKNLLLNAVKRNLEINALRENVSALRQETSHDPSCPDPVLGVSPVMKAFWTRVKRIAEMEIATAILVTGESGTGKEVVARQIHRWSKRYRGPMISTNCGMLTRELAASELMGVAKGVATGVEPRRGKFSVADGGTLFLDEVAELPCEVQPMLLRALQERKIVPVGTANEIPIDVRVVAATNKDLNEDVQNGEFREDLLYRLSVVTIEIPPLRQRREDIPLLLQHLHKRHGGTGTLPLDSTEMVSWQECDWPGNIRQLENALINRIIAGHPIEPGRMHPGAAQQAEHIIDLSQSIEFDEIKRRVFSHALRQADGNLREAARKLGVAKSTLWEYFRKNSAMLTETESK